LAAISRSSELISAEITDFILRNHVVKFSNTGHFLLRVESETPYNQIKKDIGDEDVFS
jgi:hypothetical protein